MEADWEVEVGGGAPVIEADWPGFMDLRTYPERAEGLAEAADFADLAKALRRLNADESPVWTSKCDFWPKLELSEFDGDEMEAPLGKRSHGMGSYVDLLPRAPEGWASLAKVEAANRLLCAQLAKARVTCCRIDLVIRRVALSTKSETMGITAYVTACGHDADEAKKNLGLGLAALADAAGCAWTIQ
jgi:hypothetical protein